MDASSAIASGEVADLAAAIEGRVFERGTDGYEAARQALAWNGRVPPRYPEVIVAARAVGDVCAAVRFASRHGLPVHVRSGGHSYAALFLQDGGLVVDLSALRAIAVDPSAMMVSVGSGVTSAAVDAALEPHGLAFPVGHGGPVGIAGFLLGGGLGINCAAWGGMSTFNILGAEVVLADGRECTVGAEDSPDLLWALRGGGPGLPFIVTRFHLRCYRRPAAITASTYTDRLSALPKLAALLDDMAPRLDRRLQLMLAAVPVPPDLAGRCGPQDHGRVAALTAIAFADSAAAAQAMHAPLAAHADLRDVLHRGAESPIGFADIFAQTDQLLSCPRVRADNIQAERMADAAGIMLRHLPHSPSSATVCVAVRRGQIAAGAAFSLSGHYSLSTYAQWDDARDDAANAGWLHGFHDDLESIAAGAYVNEFDLEARSDKLDLCHAGPARVRLRAIRAAHDPAGVFWRP